MKKVLPTGTITQRQVIDHFGRSNSLWAYRDIPGNARLTSFRGLSAYIYHWGWPHWVDSADYGYYYYYTVPGWEAYSDPYSLDYYYGDHWGCWQDYGQTEIQMTVTNCGDVSSQYAWAKQWVCIAIGSLDPEYYLVDYSGRYYWNYSDSFSSNAIYLINMYDPYYNEGYWWLVKMFDQGGTETWMEFKTVY